MKRIKRQWKRREFIRILWDNGYCIDRKSASSHQVYTNGKFSIAVPLKLNPMLANRLIKENSLKV